MLRKAIIGILLIFVGAGLMAVAVMAFTGADRDRVYADGVKSGRQQAVLEVKHTQNILIDLVKSGKIKIECCDHSTSKPADH